MIVTRRSQKKGGEGVADTGWGTLRLTHRRGRCESKEHTGHLVWMGGVGPTLFSSLTPTRRHGRRGMELTLVDP